jgi:glycosyltransferase involved in cell wall biosynthesis
MHEKRTEQQNTAATAASLDPSPLRLAHAIHSGGFYGAEKVVCDLGREQLACPVLEPRLLALLDPGRTGNEVSDRAAALGMPVHFLQASRGLSWKGLQAYARTLREEGIGLVHSHGYKATAFHLCSRWLGMHRVPLVVTAHGYPKGSGNLKATLYRWLDILFLGSAESVVAVSREMEGYLRARNPACRLRTIPNGIRPETGRRASHPLLEALASDPAPGAGAVIGTAGRLVPMKNQELLIRAYAETRKTHPCRLVILGDGPLRPSLEALWRELLPDEPVRLYPFQAAVLDWMADMDIFALPSNDGEGLPIALLEAGLLERAVVCSRSGGMPEVVRDGETGRLFETGDLQGLISVLRDLVAHPETRRAQGKALRLEVLESHDIRATHAGYLEAYAHVLADA